MSKDQLAFSSLIAKYDAKGANKILALLPPSKRPDQVVEGGAVFTKSIDDALSELHYSWIAPAVTAYPEPLQPYLIAALPESLLQTVASFLEIEPKKSGPIMERFLRQRLYNDLFSDETIPLELLPRGPMSPLLDLDKKELISFISFLGIRDVAACLKMVVDRTTIAHLQAAMSEQKYRYLLAAMRQQDPFPSPKWELAGWKGSGRELERLLQSRGLMRLGVALKEEHPALAWHVIRRLDRVRGEKVGQQIRIQWEAAIRRAAHRQAVDLLEFIA